MQTLHSTVLLTYLAASVGCTTGETAEDSDDPRYCEDSYTITSEADLEAISPCMAITGDLVVQDQVWITELELPDLQYVGGNMTVRDNAALTHVGMPSLSAVYIRLRIDGNPMLTEFDLSSLETVGERFYIGSNDSLTGVASLSALRDVGEDLHFCNHRSLVSLQGLTDVAAVGRSLRFDDSLILFSLEGAPTSPSIGQWLTVVYNACLDEAEAWAYVDAVGTEGFVEVHDNDGPCEPAAVPRGSEGGW